MSAAGSVAVALARADQIAPGQALRVEVAGFPALAVFNLDGVFHVTDDRCTHGDASLADGEIDAEEGVVECPWHQGAFHIATGKPCGAPCTVALKVYPVRVEAGMIVVEG